MSTSADVPSYGSGKGPLDSATEVPRRYDIDVVDDDLGLGDYHDRGDGFTRYDQKDMRRMGKSQELMVRRCCVRVPSSVR